MPDSQETVYEQQLLDEQPQIVRKFFMPVGQNSKDFASAIDADEVASLLNADTTVRGLRKTRPGYTQIANDLGSDRVVGLGKFFIQGGSKFLLMVSANAVYGWQASGNWAALTGVTPTTDLITNILVAGGKAFFLNGTDNVYYTANGSTLTSAGNTNTDFPKSRFGIYLLNRILAAGNGTNKSWIYYSDPWVGSGNFVFDRAAKAFLVADQNGDELTALINMSITTDPGAIAFKNKSTHFLLLDSSTPANSTLVQIDPVHGCVGPRAATPIGSSRINGDCAFLSKEGETYRLRSLMRTINDSVGTGGILSYKIEDVLSDVNDAKMNEAIVVYFNERIFMAIPSGSSTYLDTLCVLDLRNSDANSGKWKWSIWTGLNIGAMGVFEENSVEYLYFGDGTGNTVVYRALYGTDDNGTAIAFTEESRREDFGLPELDKIFQFVEVIFLGTDDGAQANVYAQIDGDGYTQCPESPVDLVAPGPHLPINLPFQLSASNVIRKVFQLDNMGIGRDIQIKIESSSRVNLVGYTIVAFLEPLHLETRRQS